MASHMPVPDVQKRPRDELTDRLIQEALEEEEQRKRAKKGLPPTGTWPVTTKRAHKGKTLAEIEDEEGGPVKESLVGMAHVKRAQRRRAGTAAETDLPDDIAEAEEHYEGEDEEEEDGGDDGEDERAPRKAQQQQPQQPQQQQRGKKKGGEELPPLPGDDAAPLTAFNLNEERQEGHFDEEGNFVFDKGDPGDRDDEWLRSDEGKAVISAELRKKVEAEHAAMKAADAAPVLSEAQVARAQLEMSGLMKEGETVAAALRRMRGGGGGRAAAAKKAMGKREKARLAKLEAERAAKQGGAGAAAGGEADEAGFARLTELADTLVSAGELDVYGSTCEQLKRWAALVLPRAEVEGKAAGGAAGGAAAAGAAGDDDGGDMFADDDAAAPTGAPAPAAAAAAAPAAAAAAPTAPPPPAAAAPAPAPAAAPPAAPVAAAAAADDGYDEWPIKELRRFLQERGEDSAGIVEKGELVARVRAAAARGPARTAG